VNVEEVPAVKLSPEFRVAVNVTPVPPVERVTPVKVIELVPDVMNPETVQPIVRALPLFDK